MLKGKCTICRACEPCFAIRRVQKTVFLWICCNCITHRRVDLHRCQLFLENFRDILTTPTPRPNHTHATPVSIKLRIISAQHNYRTHARMREWLPQTPPTTRLIRVQRTCTSSQTIALVFLHILNVDMAFTVDCKLI